MKPKELKKKTKNTVASNVNKNKVSIMLSGTPVNHPKYIPPGHGDANFNWFMKSVMTNIKLYSSLPLTVSFISFEKEKLTLRKKLKHDFLWNAHREIY